MRKMILNAGETIKSLSGFIVVLCVLVMMTVTAGAQSPIFEKSDAELFVDNKTVGVPDIGDTVKWRITINNVTCAPALIDLKDVVPTGLGNVTILNYPSTIVFNPSSIGTMSFKLDAYDNSGPGNPYPYMNCESVSTNPDFNSTDGYAGVFSGYNTVNSERYNGFCVELNQNINLNTTYNMTVWNSIISAPIQDGKPKAAGQPITLEQKLMIQGIFHCLGVDCVQPMTSSTAQDVSMVLGVYGNVLKTLTNEQAAATQIALWEIVHENWSGPSSVSLTSGLITWQVKVGGTYQLPQSFVDTFNNLVICATTYVQNMSRTVDITETTTKTLSVKHINIQSGAVATIEFTTEITSDAGNCDEIVNTASGDLNEDDIGDLSDTGKTAPIQNGTISGKVWEDLDDNGAIDVGEDPFANVTISFVWAGPDGTFGNSDDETFAPVDTNSSGDFEFNELPAGKFRITADKSDIDAKYVLTTASNPLEVTLNACESITDANFGFDAIEFTKTDALQVVDVNENGLLDVGDTVAFTIIIVNPSGSTAIDVDVLDPLPIGLSNLDYTYYPDGADITHSNATLLDVRNIHVAAGDTVNIIFTTVINVDAQDGEIIENTACCDADRDGDSDLCDPGVTTIIKNKQEPPQLEDFCKTGYIISTEAGIGKNGHVGDGGPATSARLNYPMQAAVDQDNNLFIADYSNHVIRRIDALTGIITTVAGTPATRGYAGDGGQATSALLSFPSDVWIRGSNMYIAELGNSVIRIVDMLTGIISTVAGNGTEGYSGDGGPATLAQLYRPRAVYVDVAGNIFIADTFNFVMRKVDAATGIITTVMGNGVAGHAEDGDITTSTSIEWLHDIVASKDGTLYFSEQNGYNLVRKIVNNRIYTVTGKAGKDSLGDCGPAEDSYLYKPYGLAFDSYDNLYIADEYNNKIRKVECLTGFITTIAGTGEAGYNGDGKVGVETMVNRPSGVVVGSDNILHIADRYNHRIRKIDLDDPQIRNIFPSVPTGYIDTIAGNGASGYNGDGSDARTFRLNYPGGVAIDSLGNVFIADRSNHRIRKVMMDWSIVTYAGKNAPRGYSGDGGQAINAVLNFPTDVAFDADGNLYIADQYNNVIRKVTPDGIISTVVGTGAAGFGGDGGQALSAQLNMPESVAVYGNLLYISDRYNNRIRMVNLTSNVITTFAGNGMTGQGAENVLATQTPLDSPRGIDIGAGGNVYIAAGGQNKIRKVATNGMISTVAGTGISGSNGDSGPAINAQLRQPVDVAVGPGGVLFIADYTNHKIRKVDAAGIISTLAGTGTAGYTGDENLAALARLNYPTGVAINASGDLFISDRLNHVVRAVGH